MVEYVKFWMAYELSRFFWFLIIVAIFALVVFAMMQIGRWHDRRMWRKKRNGKR